MWASAYRTLGVCNLACSLVLGCFVIDRFAFPGRAAFQSLLLSPIVIPILVFGIALLYLMSFLGIGPSLAALLVGHILVSLPYIVRALLNGLSCLSSTLEEAALNLGLSPCSLQTR